MIFKTDWPATRQGISYLSLQGAQEELVNLEGTSKGTSWPFRQWTVEYGWVSTGTVPSVCLVPWKLSAWQCQVCCVLAAWVQGNWKSYWFNSLNKSALCSKVFHCCSWIAAAVAQTSTFQRAQASVWLWGAIKRNARWAHSLWPKIVDPEGQIVTKSKLIWAIIIKLFPEWSVLCFVLIS